MYRSTPQPQRTPVAVAVAVVVAIGVGILWGLFPVWAFWFAIGGGFGITEGIVRFAGVTRGSTYQAIGMVAVALCVVVSRTVMANRTGIDLGDLGGTLAGNRIDSPRAGQQLGRLGIDLPNLVYIALALAIPWYRFR